MEFYNEILQANFFRYSVKDSSSYFCAISRKDSGQYLKQFCRQSLKESQEMFLTELQKCVGIFAGFFSRNSWNYHWKIYNKMFRGISMKEILRKKKIACWYFGGFPWFWKGFGDISEETTNIILLKISEILKWISRGISDKTPGKFSS